MATWASLRCANGRVWPSLVACGVLVCVRAQAETAPRVLDRATVAKLAATQSPSVVVAERRIDEARALRVGADVPQSANPELSAFAGPRWQSTGRSTDFFVGVTVPFEISGAGGQRARVADARTRVAESEADVSKRVAVAEALDLWARARGTDERARLETNRLAIDRALVRAADTRRKAGTSGDTDVALAHVLEAQDLARKVALEHERDALLNRLRSRLGIPATDAVAVGGSLTTDELPAVETLLARIRTQPAVARAAATIAAAQSDESLQRKLGTPVPKLLAGGGRDPESYLHFGLDLPVPLFQRNQTNVAVSGARVQTARAEYSAAVSLAEADLRAAYLEYEGAREAYRALDAALPAIEDAEHLATRSYELGQSTLGEVATAHREASAARLALIDAAFNVARARVAVDLLAGTVP